MESATILYITDPHSQKPCRVWFLLHCIKILFTLIQPNTNILILKRYITAHYCTEPLVSTGLNKTLLSSGMLCYVIWQYIISIQEKPAAPTFRIEKSFAKDGRQWVLLKHLYLAELDVTSNETIMILLGYRHGNYKLI